ncbi:MAG: TRAP transporter small permease subunit [Spirochaetaceae bacterium]|jgi:TRAP-type C4-dicarboxylate transport system permease small subunit|nr:TRAP transporter small permease subunit [Spirochaetaceae bacterium]
MRKIYKALCKTEEIICGTFFVAIVILVFMSAVLRLFLISWSWNMDAAMLLLAWASFLGADCAFRYGQMVGIDLVTRQFPQKVQNIIAIAVLIIILAGLCLFAYFGIKLVLSDRHRSYSSLPISFSWATLSLPFAALSMILTTILKIRVCILNFNKN